MIKSISLISTLMFVVAFSVGCSTMDSHDDGMMKSDNMDNMQHETMAKDTMDKSNMKKDSMMKDGM